MKADDPLIRAFANVTFGMGTASKRFANDMLARPDDYELSEKAERFAWRIAYHYRRQLPRVLAEEAERRKQSHQWAPINHKIEKFGLKCLVCQQTVWHRGSRSLNAPCAGPPDPPKPKKERSRTRGAAPAVAVSGVAPHPSLFGGEP